LKTIDKNTPTSAIGMGQKARNFTVADWEKVKGQAAAHFKGRKLEKEI
jgi:predicted NAD-dependent protein-ADP-ribosyltransferase YbiA (DUF1768 family)